MAESRFSYRWLLGFLILWVVLFGIWRLYQAPREARARLAHMRHVLAVVAHYVRQHQGAWPRSWEEIEKTPVPPEAPPRLGAWPDVRHHVKVDFQVDPRKLLQTGPDQFQAISPRGRCGDYREDVQRLLEAIREALPQETEAQKPEAQKAPSSVPGAPGGKSSETAAATKLRPKEAASFQPDKMSPDRPAKETAMTKDRPSPPSGPGEKAVAEPSYPAGKLPGLPQETDSKAEPSSPAAKLPGLPQETEPKPPTEKPSAPQPTTPEKPSPKEKSETPPSKPPRIILPGLD